MKFPLKFLQIKFSNTLLYVALASPACLVAAGVGQAIEVAAGLSAVEEGDDRLRPALSLHGAINETYAFRMYYYGREFGPVREDTVLISGHRRFSLFGTDFIKAQLGVALMDEITKISYDKAEDKKRNEEEHNTNIGGAVGISISLPPHLAPFYAHLSWDSHIFPAGVGGILLSTGRKQTISIAAGAAF
jgi:hypothetical protein